MQGMRGLAVGAPNHISVFMQRKVQTIGRQPWLGIMGWSLCTVSHTPCGSLPLFLAWDSGLPNTSNTSNSHELKCRRKCTGVFCNVFCKGHDSVFLFAIPSASAL